MERAKELNIAIALKDGFRKMGNKNAYSNEAYEWIAEQIYEDAIEDDEADFFDNEAFPEVWYLEELKREFIEEDTDEFVFRQPDLREYFSEYEIEPYSSSWQWEVEDYVNNYTIGKVIELGTSVVYRRTNKF